MRLLATVLTAVAIFAGQTQAASADQNGCKQACTTWSQEKARHYPNGVRPYWMPKLYWAIAQCETPPGRWDHNSGTYQGAFGFYYGSWDAYKPAGYPAEAYQASAWQQYVVARNIAQSVGLGAWGCYSHGGYRSHL